MTRLQNFRALLAKNLRSLLLRNLGWKLLSLTVAVVLWFTFVGSPDLITSVLVPVEYMHVPPELEIIPESLERVHLDVRGPAARLRSFEASGTAVILDLSGVTAAGERTFTITPHQINLPTGLTLVRSVPAQVRLRFERRASRQLPVRIQIGKAPPPGYRIKEQQVQPPMVTVTGPESRVEEAEFVETDPIDLSQVVSQQEFQAHVFIRDPQLRIETVNVVSIHVTMEKAAGGTSHGQTAVRH